MIKEILQKFLKTHWFSLIAIGVLSLCLKIALKYSFILSFILLLIAYFVLGILVEFFMEKQTVARGNRYKQARERVYARREMNATRKATPMPGDAADDDDDEDEDQNQEDDIEITTTRPVLQKKNTPYCPPSRGLEKLERTRAQFVEVDTSETEEPDDADAGLSDFLERTHQMYKTNQMRNKAPKNTSDEEPEDGEEPHPVETVTVTPVHRPVKPTPVTIQMKEPVKKVMQAPVPETPEAMQTSEDMEQQSDDLSKEIDKRIEESQRSMTRRKKDYSFEGMDMEVQSALKPIPVVKPAFYQPIAEPKSFEPEPQRETTYSDDKVHADRDMINTLFEMKRTQEPVRPAHPRRTVEKNTTPATTIPAPAEYDIPSVELLKGSRPGSRRDVESDGMDDPRAQKLIDTLASFGVGAKVTAVIKGPAVTRYEIQPNPGVKVSRIVSLADDISLNLAATGVRIEAPIPGKEAVGIEVPNREVEIVYLKDVIDSKEYRENGSNLTFAIGKDIAGTNIVHDIAKMPHLLIAGATGAGKSVCINTIIASILYKSGPEHVRMIMIDPKIVELGVYNGIPHLLVPVVTNPKKAAAALAWAVGEMERRYGEFSQYNVRDIRAYNDLARKRKTMMTMPQIVIIIDELADLMMVAAKEIEDSIIRLAQKARAAGLHLIIATQRPSVDVITGLIKANIPSRIAFAVSSQVDSRTILDGSGAEKLLGRGDMLFHPIGMSKPMRVQGAFVSDGEIEALVSEIKRSCGTVTYSEEIQASMEAKMNSNAGSSGNGGAASSGEDEDCDTEVIQAAAELAFEYKQLSTSFLQRKLKLGYSRASRVVDALENMGVISGSDGSKPRQLLMTREEWESRQ